jgi:hypothetical protein
VTGLAEHRKAAVFLNKAAQKTFVGAAPVALKPARPSLKKFFGYFLFTKTSLPLRFDKTCPKSIML